MLALARMEITSISVEYDPTKLSGWHSRINGCQSGMLTHSPCKKIQSESGVPWWIARRMATEKCQIDHTIRGEAVD